MGWPELLVELGVEESYLDGRHHPCPSSGQGKDRFRFSNHKGKGTFFCKCSFGGDAYDLLNCIHGWDFKRARREVCKITGEPCRTDNKKFKLEKVRARLRSAYSASRPVSTDGFVARYLMNRGLEVPNDSVLREGKLYDYESKESHNVMLAPVYNGDNAVTLHVTYLTTNGQKADIKTQRRVLPGLSGVSGGGIPLQRELRSARHIGIAEGIETALACYQIFGVPTWSCISRSGMEKFNPPEGVEEVTIFGDNDLSFAGQAGAYRAAERLVSREYRCNVQIPSMGDWADHI